MLKISTYGFYVVVLILIIEGRVLLLVVLHLLHLLQLFLWT